MADQAAIRMHGVSKSYKLYPGPASFALDVFGLYRFLPLPALKTFEALHGVDLEVARGERLGIIGRNGAGKSTLLKLITGNFAPTSGTVSVNGQVHSLMDAGVGFHPEFTGLENIRASLLYNGVSRADMASTVDEIVDFVELGEFLEQPIKTYSLGMVARLGFATATAVKPDILIIDEVLGAGDAYFMAKCAERIKNLSSGGVTLLLVSHALSQIVQFCQRAVWLDKGAVVRSGDALDVAKEYEAFIRNMDEHRLIQENAARLRAGQDGQSRSLERWKGVSGPKIEGIRMLDAAGNESAVFESGKPASIEIRYRADADGEFPCRYHVYVYTLDGTRLFNHLSEVEHVRLRAGESRTVRLEYDRLRLGNGEFVFTAGIYKTIDLRAAGPVEFYDLIDRSFQFRVFTDQSGDTSLVHHDCRWRSSSGTTIEDSIASSGAR